jgi:uncharacterized membrane protein YeaQ/YmgE (transglycosylase-associated protein family)
MNSYPPPLPEPDDSTNDSSFARQAANACLAAPLILLGLSFFLRSLLGNHRDASGRSLVLTMGTVSAVIVLVGVVLGLLALVLARPGQRSGVFLRAGIGLGISGLFIAIAIPNFLEARRKSLANKAAWQNVQAATKDLRQEAADAIEQGGGHGVNFAKYRSTLDQASKGATGDAAVMMKAMNAYLGHIELLQKGYETSSLELQSAHVLQTSDLKTQRQIAERKAIVQKFLEANDSLKAFVSQSALNYRKELVNLKVPQERVDAAMRGFEKTSSPQVTIVIEIRSADDRMGAAMLGILDLLNSNWDNWHFNQTTGKLRFDNAATLQRYNAYIAEINQAGTDQAMAQNRLVVKMRKPISSL